MEYIFQQSLLVHRQLVWDQDVTLTTQVRILPFNRACGSYQDFLDIGLLLTRKLLNQWFLYVKLKSSLRKFYGHHHDLTVMKYLCHKRPPIFATCGKHFPVLSSFMTYHKVCNQINTTGATGGAGTAYPSRAPEFTPGFQLGSCYSIFSFMCMFCRSLFVLLSFLFWPLCCLSFFWFTNFDQPFNMLEIVIVS